MAHLKKVRITRFLDAEGNRVPKGTAGARRVKEKSSKWYGVFVDENGKKQRKPLSANKTAAQQMLADLVRKTELGRAGVSDPFEGHRTRPLTEHLAEFEAFLVHKGDGARHVRDTVARVRKAFEWCKFVFIRDIASAKLQEYLSDLQHSRKSLPMLDPAKEWYTRNELAEALGLRPQNITDLVGRHRLEGVGNGKARRYPRATAEALTVRIGGRSRGTATANHYLRAVKAFTTWLVNEDRTDRSPLAKLKRGNPKSDKRRVRRALMPDQLRNLLAVTRVSLRTHRGLTGHQRFILYATAMTTGYRAHELASVRPESFDLGTDRPTATVEAPYAKNREKATQPIPQDLAEALRSHLADVPAGRVVWPGSWWEKAAEMLRRDLDEAGLPFETEEGVVDFHGLRHSYITLLVRSGVSPKVAQELARHSDINLTMNTYTHVQIHDKAGAIDGLPSLLPSVPPKASRATGTEG